jgi:hypothetical protein
VPARLGPARPGERGENADPHRHLVIHRARIE